MASKGAQSFIKRNRPPRVQIAYQDPHNEERQIELPFVMGVMADLSGNNAGVEKGPIEKRKFLDIDMDSFEKRMAAIKPGVAFRVDNKLAADGQGEKLSVTLQFDSMNDFTPAAVARQVPALKEILEARTQLANLLRYMDGRVDAEDKLRALLADPQLMQAIHDRAAALNAPSGKTAEGEDTGASTGKEG